MSAYASRSSLAASWAARCGSVPELLTAQLRATRVDGYAETLVISQPHFVLALG